MSTGDNHCKGVLTILIHKDFREEWRRLDVGDAGSQVEKISGG